jgi:carboxypeptidase Q
MRRSLVAIFSIAVLVSLSSSQTPAGESASSDEIARIVGYSLTRGGAYNFLERLTDEVGGRITGSPQSQAASELILHMLKEAGYDNAHYEGYEFNPGWHKGPTTAEVVRPMSRQLYVGTYGWVPGTPGPIEVPVADIGSVNNGMPDIPASVHGAAVLVDLRSNALSTTYVPIRAQVTKRLAQLGAAAMLIISDKPDRMLYTSAFLFFPRGPLPVLSIAQDDAGLLRRLLAKGEVRVRLNVQNSFDDHPVRERNVVADLDGPDRSQMVLLTAHFDSWDAAEAANDNGVGVAAVLEAARILKFMNVRPQHRLRFVFFSGEEQDNLGSRAYAEQHKNELDNIWAIINTDHGAQAPPLGLHLFGRPDLKAATEAVLKPLAAIDANHTFMDAAFDSDEETFMVLGVPTFSIAVDDGDYNARHHTIIDTLDRVDPRLLSLQTAVLAVAGLGFADADQRPGKRLSPSEVHELLQRTGLESLYELEYPGEKPY